MKGVEDKLVDQRALQALSFPAEPEFNFEESQKRQS
jgi:hypothetical protein